MGKYLKNTSVIQSSSGININILMRDFFKYWSNNKWKPDKSLVKWCDLIWQLYASHDTAAYMDIANSEYVKVYFLKN